MTVARLLSIALAIGLLLPDAAMAQTKPRYTRNVKVDVKVKRTERTQKLQEKAKEKSELKPQLSADEFMLVLGKIQLIKQDQIMALEELIEETDNDDAELPDLYFRVGEAYAQMARYWDHRAMELHSKIDKAAKAQKSGLRSKQTSYFNESKKFLVKAIKAYKSLFCHPQDIANNVGLGCRPNPQFRNYPRMDTALFYFAFTLQIAKQIADSRKVYARLIKDYPKSKHIPDAFLAFAEYYFDEGSLENAERFYDKVLQFPEAPIYTYALYKKGWVYLNQDRNQEAYEVFAEVARLTTGKKGKETINSAAKKDAVRAYAEMGKAETALQAFSRIDRKYAPRMLEILADLYMEKGKGPKAIYSYRELIGMGRDKQPDGGKRICEWQYNVVHAMLTFGADNDKVKEIENLVKLYTFLKKGNAIPKENLTECFENAAGVTSEMAKIWHNEAMKTLNTDTLAYVERLYGVYLDNFPDAEDAGEMQYYYAELVWQRAEAEKNPRNATEMWEKAAILFTDVVKANKVDKEKRKASAYAAVLGWKNALDVDPRPKGVDAPKEMGGTDAAKIPQAQPIPEREQKMIAAFDVYIDYIKDPKDEELVMMKFLKAKIFWRYNQFDKALPMFEDIIRNHPQHETSEYSINLLLDTLNRTQQYGEMLKWVDTLLGMEKQLASKTELWDRLKTLKRQGKRKAIDQYRATGKNIECGQGYLEIFNDDPNAPDAHEVLYNAGVCFQDAKSMGAARTMFNILSQRYPDKPVTQKAIARLGYIFGRVAWYDKAAEKYEEYARRFGGEKDAFDALSQAVFYYKGIGEDDKAIKSTTFFIKQYAKDKKKADKVADAHFSLVTIYEKETGPEAEDKIIAHLRSYLKSHAKAGGYDREIVARVKIGKILWRQSCPLKTLVDGSCVKVTRQRATAIKKQRKKKGKKKAGEELPRQCGPESKIKLVVQERDKGTSSKALAEFRAAVDLVEKKGALDKIGGEAAEKEGRKLRALDAYAAAKFHLVEPAYEKFLTLEFPKGLDFGNGDASDKKQAKKKDEAVKRFKEWISAKGKLMTDMTRQEEDAAKDNKPVGAYRKILSIPNSADWAIASAARIGQIAQNFSDALFTAEIPAVVRTGEFAEDKVDAYCDQLMTEADPLENLSVSAYSFCLDVSTRNNWFNSWSKLCERELGQIRPADFPTATELHESADDSAPITDIEPAVGKLAE